MKFFDFIETSRFTKKITKLLSDDDYAKIQLFLCASPDFGKIIKGGSGIRKIRCRVEGRGKSGGARVIYFWAVSREQILMLDVYAKNEKENLTPEEIKILRQEYGGIIKMKRENFVGLVESIREAGKIQRGEIAPSRVFRIEVPENYENTEGFALCVKTDDAKLLVPSKIYQARFSPDGSVGIIDEEGEAAIYQADFFIRLDIPVEVEQALGSLQVETV